MEKVTDKNRIFLNVRRLSFCVLYDVFFNEKKLNICFDNVIEKHKNIKDEDVSFLKRETSGVIENLNDIDSVINKFSKVKTVKLDRDILIILRLAIYEILFLNKVPDYAVVNEYVNMAKESKNYNLSGYVNAILRNVLRDNELLLKYSNESNCNEIIKNCYFRIYNDHEQSVISELSQKGISYSRYEGELKFKYAKVYKVNRYSDILNTESFKCGDILIEDASSIFMTDMLSYFIKKREKDISSKSSSSAISMMKLLDCCASPGGKILGLIDIIYNDYYYFYAEARDISKEKILKICENVNRLKVLDLNMNVRDASIPYGLDNEKYDVIICDVPCTGLGVIEKKPDIKLRFNDEKLDSLVKLQRRILDSQSMALKKGGILSYSTCTETQDENSDNIRYFLNNHNDFNILYEKQILRGDGNNSDGFYMCFLQKN